MAPSSRLFQTLVVVLLVSSVFALNDRPGKKRTEKSSLQQRDQDSEKSSDSDEKITLKFRAFMNRRDFSINDRVCKFMKSPHPLQIEKSADFGDLLKMIATEDFGAGKFTPADVQRYRIIFRGGVLRPGDGRTVGDYGLEDGDELVLRLHDEDDKAGFWKKLAIKGLLGVISYGKYCGPSHGEVDSLQVPDDALDAACRKHDQCWSYTTLNDCICNRRASIDFESARVSCHGGILSKCKLMAKHGSHYFGTTKCQCLGVGEGGKTFYNGFPVKSPHDCGAVEHPLFPRDQISLANGFVDKSKLRTGAIPFEIDDMRIKQWMKKLPGEKDVSPRDE